MNLNFEMAAFRVFTVRVVASDDELGDNYLAQTNLAADINNRNSITVLAVDNSGMAPVSGKSMDVIKNVLSLHVILDYFDVQKLQHLQNKSITVRTLFDTSDQAHGLQGFVNITAMSNGAVSFVSAFDTTNDSIGCNLIKSLVSQPYNISVVHVSTVIMPPFLLANSNAPALAPAPAPVVSVTPVPMPVLSLVPVPTPVPGLVPVPVPVAIPVPVVSPVPVLAPVPIVSPVPVPVPVPVMIPSAGGEPTPADAAADAPPPPENNKSGAGILKFCGVNSTLTLVLTFFSRTLLSRSIIS
ncbi:hypothetical protein Lal_00046270 [Lupinus albus]|nr:hypothetical protein Lal_00046270 [Lupinus albus]